MLETSADIGPENFHGNRGVNAILHDLGAMDLSDRSRGNRLTEARKHLCHRLIERRLLLLPPATAETGADGPADFRDPAPSSRRPHRAGCANCPELDVGRTQPRQCARQTPACRCVAPFDQSSDTNGKPCSRRKRIGIGDSEYALAREHECGAR